MDRYRKLKVIGKGSFGYAVQVQSVADRHTYVMKVKHLPAHLSPPHLSLLVLHANLALGFLSLDYRCVKNG